ncbi:ankyrin repeat-containing domain protein [Vararia minispora EC-137]|uniref:Ankyrin repeat-containing domain protein n=1 Tax=Vararia minispora EC-137 TaxID=1314806 RepID=A0ACB8QP52_9AGAM|nr:ankyrin repeat-containing domain protein [Vararia minispora EC-137]
MPVAESTANIWVAAGDGDLARVQTLVDAHGISPNAPDPHTYTPMHAAASYGHTAVLDFLLSRGGDVNVADADADTPLYTVEDIPTARWLLDHGATLDIRNAEGLSPIEHLSEDFPAVAAYLCTRLPQAPPDTAVASLPPTAPSQHAQERASAQLADGLVAAVADLAREAEAQGRDEPDEDALRRAVSAAVLASMRAGYAATALDDGRERDGDADEGAGAKRARTEP